MTTLIGEIDLKRPIEKLPYKFGKDYVAVYDSTMARFWFKNSQAKKDIIGILEKENSGNILNKEELEKFGVYFEDNMYGEIFFLLEPGYQIVPSDMGINSLPGMHGYHPEDKDSIASFLGTNEVKNPPKWVGDYFKIMLEKMDEIVKK
jgi:hypothetical protein